MVLPLVDEDKPKCYLCHEGFEDIEKLKKHQNIAHKDFFESNEKQTNRESAPGDVTVF
jgi:quinol monooxygenase YgiN